MGGMRVSEASARSTGTFGRVLVSARDKSVLADGPVWNGCLGEEITPGEMFLGAVAACGVELIEVIARDRGVPLRSAAVEARGLVDPQRPVRSDVTVYNSVTIHFRLEGVSDADGVPLVESFKGR